MIEFRSSLVFQSSSLVPLFRSTLVFDLNNRIPIIFEFRIDKSDDHTCTEKLHWTLLSTEVPSENVRSVEDLAGLRPTPADRGLRWVWVFVAKKIRFLFDPL